LGPLGKLERSPSPPIRNSGGGVPTSKGRQGKGMGKEGWEGGREEGKGRGREGRTPVLD